MKQFYTMQISQWRKAKEMGLRTVDTTVKSGHLALAPTWELLRRYKENEINDDIYTDEYYKLLFQRYQVTPNAFDPLFGEDEKPVALMCYCGAGKFCHRYLLMSFLSNNFEATWLGEITSNDIITEAVDVYPYYKWVRGFM